MQFKYHIKVRYAETDQMGVVHHGVYPIYFEAARVEWLENFNMAYHQLEKDGMMMPIYDLKVKYHAPAYFGDQLQVDIKLVDLQMFKLKFDYRIYNQHEKVITSGSTILVFMDAETRKPIKCPKWLQDKLTQAL